MTPGGSWARPPKPESGDLGVPVRRPFHQWHTVRKENQRHETDSQVQTKEPGGSFGGWRRYLIRYIFDHKTTSVISKDISFSPYVYSDLRRIETSQMFCERVWSSDPRELMGSSSRDNRGDMSTPGTPNLSGSLGGFQRVNPS